MAKFGSIIKLATSDAPMGGNDFSFSRDSRRVEARARLGHPSSASAPPTPLSCSYGVDPTEPRMLAFVRRPCDLR